MALPNIFIRVTFKIKDQDFYFMNIEIDKGSIHSKTFSLFNYANKYYMDMENCCLDKKINVNVIKTAHRRKKLVSPKIDLRKNLL